MTMRSSETGPTTPHRAAAIGLAVALLLGVIASIGVPTTASAAAGIAAHAPVQIKGLGTRQPNLRASAASASSDSPLSPSQIRSAYSLPSTGARGQKIAVVSTYDAPHIQFDLDAYDRYFGLAACNGSDGCFTKLNEQGKPSPLPIADPSGGQWITESSIGVEVARGICQSCSIVLMEANAGDNGDLAKTIAAAAKQSATVIVTAVTPSENTLDSDWSSTIDSVPAAVVAAAGDAPSGSDFGYGSVDFPASLPNVLAVGGTNLQRSGSGGYRSESVWSPTVSGCSTFNKAPSWQTADAAKVGCGSQRAVADLAAMSEPGALVHITGISASGGPWYAASGTSLSAPIIAAAIGLAGGAGNGEDRLVYQRAQADPAAVHDIVSGENTAGCRNPICMAVRGYDGPTGVGSPNGLGLFQTSGGSLNPRSPKVTLSAPNGSLRVTRAWKTQVGVRNSNSFTISGKVVVRRTLRVAGRLRTVEFATKALRIGGLHRTTVTLTIARGQRALLGRLHDLQVSVEVDARGSSGKTVTISRKLQLVAP